VNVSADRDIAGEHEQLCVRAACDRDAGPAQHLLREHILRTVRWIQPVPCAPEPVAYEDRLVIVTEIEAPSRDTVHRGAEPASWRAHGWSLRTVAQDVLTQQVLGSVGITVAGGTHELFMLTGDVAVGGDVHRPAAGEFAGAPESVEDIEHHAVGASFDQCAMKSAVGDGPLAH